MIFRTGAGEPLRGWTHDLSRSGCFIATQTRVPAGEEIEIEVRLPGVVQPVTSRARVVWAREKASGESPAGMGVALVDPAEATLAAIDKVLAASAGPKRSKTIVGIAPPPATSSPSFTGELIAELEAEVKALAPGTDTAEDGVAAIHDVTSLAPPPPEPSARVAPPAPPPEPPAPVAPFAPAAPLPLPDRRPGKRVFALAAAALSLVVGVLCIVLAVRGCSPGTSGSVALDAPSDTAPAALAEPPEAEPEREAEPEIHAAPPTTSEPEPAHLRDAGHDAAPDASHDAGKKDAGKHKITKKKRKHR